MNPKVLLKELSISNEFFKFNNKYILKKQSKIKGLLFSTWSSLFLKMIIIKINVIRITTKFIITEDVVIANGKMQSNKQINLKPRSS